MLLFLLEVNYLVCVITIRVSRSETIFLEIGTRP